jgi:hypothetical protein
MIEMVFGIFLSVISPNDATADPGTMVLKGLMTKNRIEQMEKNKEVDDAIHEEFHQLSKDAILKLGGLK